MMSWNGIRGAVLGIAVGALSLMGAAATATPIDYEGSYDATSVTTGGNDHTVWLPGLFGANSDAERYWQFIGGAGDFVVGAGNGTASLSGNIQNNVNAAWTMTLDAQYTLRAPNDEGTGGGKKGGIKAPLTDAVIDTWSFFDMTSATLTGYGLLDGLILTMTTYPNPDKFPFQLGVGANDKDVSLGASGWFSYTVTTTSAYKGPLAYASGVGPAGSHGDINISLEPVPLPAAGWMLIAGLGGLAAMRRRKRAS